MKILAHNDYIGRIIGKQGNIINNIKIETKTTIDVSIINDITKDIERVITVQGDHENIICALEIIYNKLKSAIENDTKTYGFRTTIMNSMPPIPLTPISFAQNANDLSTQKRIGGSYLQRRNLYQQQNTDTVQTVYLYIPNMAVGAIIGPEGAYIKNIIKLSGASVQVTPFTPKKNKITLDRQICIVGTPEKQWKSQYYIYEKIRQEKFASDEDVKLKAELHVPANMIGRIIGKSGKNLQEIQKSTGATIMLPENRGITVNNILTKSF